jgi:formamidopyrimidine-DNA glycosylase
VAPNSDFSFIPTLHNLGPEPLSANFSAETLVARLHSKAALKTLLLNQRAVAGLGNIYVDEALWAAKVHPLLPGNQLSLVKAKKLYQAIVHILTASIESGGTTLNDYRNLNGGEGNFQNVLNAYGRTGQPCPRCKTFIERIIITQRSTHFCPKCQPKQQK